MIKIFAYSFLIVLFFSSCGHEKETKAKIKQVEEELYATESQQREYKSSVNKLYAPLLEKKYDSNEEYRNVLKSLQRSQDSAQRLSLKLEPKRDSLQKELNQLKKELNK